MVGRTLFFQLQNRQLEYGVEQSTPWEFAFHAVKTDRFECIGYEFIQLCWNLNRHQYTTKYETAFIGLLLAKVRQNNFFLRPVELKPTFSSNVVTYVYFTLIGHQRR